MHIFWHGQSCFSIKTKNQKREEINIVINPFNPKNEGIRLSKFNADIVLISNKKSSLANVKNTKNAFTVSTPGEFEIKNIIISGIQEHLEDKKDEDNIIFLLEVEGIRIAHLGRLKNPLNEKQLAKLNNTDILLIPIGGGDILDIKKAVELTNQIEPRIVIPMNYKIPALKEKLDTVDKFSKELGVNGDNIMDKLKIKKKSLPQDGSDIIILNKK